MRPRYDLERFLGDVEAALKAAINDKLSSITDEKGDGLTLKPIADAAYFLQTEDERTLNYDPFIFYGIDPSQAAPIGIGPATAETWKINVVAVLIEKQDLKIVSRLLRYQRAIKEILQERWADIGDAVKIKIEALAPVSFNLVNSSEDFRAIGVSLDVTLA